MLVRFQLGALNLCYTIFMFDSEERKILVENNKILHKLLRAQRWATAWSVVRWIVIFAITIGSYYYLQPYLDQMLKVYQQIQPQFQNLNEALKLPV